MRNYILILWTLFSFAGQAQSGDSEAQLLLNEVSAKVKSYRNLTLEFKYVLENTEENIRQETKGKVTIQGDKYVLNILGVTRIYDGESLFTISAEDEEVTISSNNTSDENTITPSELLNFYEDGYTYKVVDYLLFELWDDEYDPFYQPEGEVKGMLFQYTIKEDDNSIFEDNEIELEFLDPYEEEFYELNELESIFTNDVSEFGDKLSSIIDIQKVKESISKFKKL